MAVNLSRAREIIYRDFEVMHFEDQRDIPLQFLI